MSTISVIQNLNSRISLEKTTFFLDKQYLFSLAEKENRAIKIKPGKHCLQAKIGWYASREFHFEIQPNEDLELILSSNYRAKGRRVSKITSVLFFGGLILNAYLKSPLFVGIWLAITVILSTIVAYKNNFKGLLYYNTIGRKDFLRLKEIDF